MVLSSVFVDINEGCTLERVKIENISGHCKPYQIEDCARHKTSLNFCQNVQLDFFASH